MTLEQSTQWLFPSPCHFDFEGHYLPQGFPFSILIISSSFWSQCSFRMIVAFDPFTCHFFVNALSNSMDLAFPISCDWAVSHTCGSFQQGASSFSNFHYFLTVNFSHSAQTPSVSLTEGWKKGDMRSHSNQEITSSRWWLRDAVSELQFLTVLPEKKIKKEK